MDTPGRGPARRNDRPVPGGTAVLRGTRPGPRWRSSSPLSSWRSRSVLAGAPGAGARGVPDGPAAGRARGAVRRRGVRRHRAPDRERGPLADRPGRGALEGRRRPRRHRRGPRRPGARHRHRDRSHVPAGPLPVRRPGTRTASSPTTAAPGPRPGPTSSRRSGRPGSRRRRRSCPRTRWDRSTRATLAAVAGLLVALLIAIVAYLYVLRARRRPPDWIR